MIKWEKSYLIGVAELDEQHKNLFQFCNDLENGVKGGGISKQVLDGALKFLGGYIKNHFGQEEACMHKFACPVAQTNQLAHQEFIEAYILFQKRIVEEDNYADVLGELHYFFESWLKEHICKIDSQLKKCVHK